MNNQTESTQIHRQLKCNNKTNNMVCLFLLTFTHKMMAETITLWWMLLIVALNVVLVETSAATDEQHVGAHIRRMRSRVTKSGRTCRVASHQIASIILIVTWYIASQSNASNRIETDQSSTLLYILTYILI